MRLVGTDVHIINEGKPRVIIQLTLKCEDVDDDLVMNYTITDTIFVEISHLREKLNHIREEHPFFKMELCESPIELKF